MFTARLAAVAFSMRIGGLSCPFSARCVRYICVYGDRLLDEKTIHRPFGEKLCHEFMSGRFARIRRGWPPAAARIRRGWPPAAGRMYNLLSGRISRPLRQPAKTIQRPSGDTFGKLLLMPLCDAPAIGSAFPPAPSWNGMR